MIIREIKKSDLNTIASFEKEIFSDDAFSLDTLKKSLNDDHFIGLVATDNELIGYLFISYFGNEANILKIAVDSNNRNKGIATKLLNQMFDTLKNICVENIFLEVDENNLVALGLYRKLGFEKTRIRYMYYKNGANAIEMVKKL